MTRLKGSKNKKNENQKRIRFVSSVYRLNISYLSDYGAFQVLGKDVKRTKGLSLELESLKVRVLEQILRNQSYRGLHYHSVAWQTHQSTGQPHLDILLIYDKTISKSPSSFNYLLPLCPQRQSQTTPGVFVTGYSRNRLNKAILEYGTKEDPEPLSNLPEDVTSFLDLNMLQRDPYRYLELQMLKDPLHFNVQQYCRSNDFYHKITGWSSIKSKLRDSQVAAANLLLKERPGFRVITRLLIQQRLSPFQLNTFDSWSGYQRIVDYLNQIPTYGGKRQMKTLNLLITGSASIGKTSLFHNPNHRLGRSCVEDFCAVYPMGMSTWFPQYRTGVYKLIFWNQAKLTDYAYTTLLKLLEGSYLDLPTKGGVSPKRDNPLIVMTSNMTLEQMIQQKFQYNKGYMQMARKNLAVRVQNVIVPDGYDLFLLQKLLISMR